MENGEGICCFLIFRVRDRGVKAWAFWFPDLGLTTELINPFSASSPAPVRQGPDARTEILQNHGPRFLVCGRL